MGIVEIKAGVTALSIALLFTPFIIKFSKKKQLIASVNHRSSHSIEVPNTGGIILCFAVLMPILIFADFTKQEDFTLGLSAFVVLLITGIIDDFSPIPVFFKFLGQFIPAIVIVSSLDPQHLIIPFINEIVELPILFNYLFWIFFIVLVINAFNLIDGIDGLAISLGIIGSLFYWIEFGSMATSELVIFTVSMVAGLVGLLFYNFARKNKIFIGDTGSLFIGGSIVFFALKHLSFQETGHSGSTFFMILGSIFIPIADLLRVSFERISKGNSPFKADRIHIHHLVLDLCRGNHFLTTTLIVCMQLGILLLFQYLSKQDIHFPLSLLVAFLSYFLTILIIKIVVKRQLRTSFD